MLRSVVIDFDAELWVWDARRTETWTFVRLPADASEDIRELFAGNTRGFGSVRVRVVLGGSVWKTSIFPESGSGCYVLPVKRAVRTAESLEPGDVARVSVELIEL
ncbi:DUF1905 domain-containing protein [Actinophytocola algeriensis]|jgi:hypothetical protein|uniref:DUF1905 domain-containing protein n=1 Tax=Actinophytocola algeriensis TaxID=1768010 RepID=A0A7W7Q7W5_9PSEU|nr:hypothetical protein [Actinophytocola algeriensis]MBE1475135.1 hypothetical protein [Actinophytocola algeriensis]